MGTTVAVRAIDHFMAYTELWSGGPPPPISSPLYLPIADEIAERLGRVKNSQKVIRGFSGFQRL